MIVLALCPTQETALKSAGYTNSGSALILTQEGLRMETRVPLTKERAIENHRRLWHWVADNPSKQKEDWPGWNEEGYHTQNLCFLCQYRVDKASERKCCLLDWGEHSCIREGSIYERYEGSSDLEKRSRLAREIALLKESKDYDPVY